MKCPKCKSKLKKSKYLHYLYRCPKCDKPFYEDEIRTFWEGYNQAKRETKRGDDGKKRKS